MNKINTKIISATPEAVKRLEYLINQSEKDVKAVKLALKMAVVQEWHTQWIMLMISKLEGK